MSDMRNDLQDDDKDQGTTLQRDRTVRGEIGDTDSETETGDLNLDENEEETGDTL